MNKLFIHTTICILASISLYACKPEDNDDILVKTPSVATNEVTNIDIPNSLSGGVVINNGGSQITEQGTTNQVTLAASTDPLQDYIDIDVTGLIQDIINNKTNDFGLMLILQNESHYRSLVFASGDNLDATKQPKLEILTN